VLLQPNTTFHTQDPDGSSPLLRALGVGVLGSAAYEGHKYALRNYGSTYARKIYQYAKNFEELSPWKMGRTFAISERLSSYLIDRVHVPQTDLVRQGGLSELGKHFDSLFQGRLDLFQQGAGLTFERSTDLADPYLKLVGRQDLSVRFTEHGRLGGSSGRYLKELNPRGLKWDWSEDWWDKDRLKANFQELRKSQIPWNYKAELNLADASGLKLDVQPFLAKVGQPLADDFSNLRAWAPDALRSARDRTGRFFFELMERPQRLMADVGIGLRAGSYNKLFHIPFAGEGGIVNQFLLRRIVPAVVIGTGLRYLDYLTGHKVSDAAVSLPLKANVVRAELTDKLPGARGVTDFYSRVVPGPQYGPLALPAAGFFAGGLYHYAKVLKNAQTGKYADEIRKAGASLITPGVSAREAFTPGGLIKFLKSEGSYPGKGLLLGFAAMLPFLPGMIGSRRRADELRDVYSGKEPVAIRSGRWWDLGSTPYEGARIKEYRPHWYQLFKSRSEIRSLYGSEEEYWSHNPVLHPFRWLRDPYYLEKRHYQDRPYPIASPAFSDVPLVGPLLAATIGKIFKPPVRMHEDEWSGDDYTLYSTRLEPREGRGLPPAKPVAEFGIVHTLKRELRQFEEFIGLPGFMFHSAREALMPGYDSMGKQVFLQGSRQMTNVSRQYYEHELGAGLGPNPAGDSGLFGYSEPLRRFIQREEGIAQANEIPNTMPDWLPGDDYFTNFRVGDPYVKINEGFARLPGAGYAALHPEVEGLEPGEYPDIERFRILADVAPYSREYASYRSRIDRMSYGDTELRIEYEKILDRVKKMKDSVIRSDERRFTAETEELEGTITRADASGIRLEEYPGRIFHLSSLGYSAADLSAVALGAENDLNRSQVARQVEQKQQQLQQYFSETLSSGTRVKLTVPLGSSEHAEDIRAVVDANGRNVNQDLLESGLAIFRKDRGGAEAGAMFSNFGRAIGSLGESLSFTGDTARWNPFRYLPSPAHTKLWQERTALAQYEQDEVVGTRMRRWHRPVHDFLAPYLRGMVQRLTGERVVPEDVQHRRDLNTLSDELTYLRSLHDRGEAGRYTNQASRTAVGSNLFGSPTFIASTLPDREATYFKRFLTETDPDKRQEILDVVSPEMARALSAQWAIQDARIAQAEGTRVPETGEGGRPFSPAGLEDYKEAETRLGYGDYMRSKDVAEFFYRSGFSLPGTDSSIWDDVFDYDDVKLKILQYEGYDMHDFNIFEDRAALLWRKPWLDGAVRELTSGNDRSVENLRRSVEQLMLAARDRNPDVRTSGIASHRAKGNVRMDVEIDDDDEVLRDMRRNPERYDLQ
jgi:hypothetical protein